MKISAQKQAVNAILWIKALLSGKYKQGTHNLGDETMGFCCWGLGCKIVKKDFDPYQSWDYDFYQYVGFLNEVGKISPDFYSYNGLASINDETSAGFKRIGKYLIKHADTNFEPHVAKEIKLAFK